MSLPYTNSKSSKYNLLTNDIHVCRQSQDFEIAGNGYAPSATNGTGWEDVFNRTNHNMTIVTNEDGYYWACEDLAIVNPSIDLDQINITGASSFNFSIFK